jgi:3-oxoacyl-[acyl-carrier-protein] synthase II
MRYNAMWCTGRSRATHFALHASDLALQDAGFNGGEGMDLTRAGVAVASGIGSMQDICDGYNTFLTEQRRLSPFFVSKILISSIAGEVSIRHKLQGPNHAVATACAASAHAIGDAYNFIRLVRL